MSSLRGGTKVWKASTVNQGDTSIIAYPGSGPYVCIFILSSVTGTFQVQVSASDLTEAGLNGLSSTAVNQDGGLSWFIYSGADALAVTANTPIAFDLSPFGPQFIRLKRTDGGAASTVSSWISCFGPN